MTQQSQHRVFADSWQNTAIKDLWRISKLKDVKHHATTIVQHSSNIHQRLSNRVTQPDHWCMNLPQRLISLTLESRWFGRVQIPHFGGDKIQSFLSDPICIVIKLNPSRRVSPQTYSDFCWFRTPNGRWTKNRGGKPPQNGWFIMENPY